jgi:Lrp/AsnC family leucine-responsive transcriptional regulator
MHVDPVPIVRPHFNDRIDYCILNVLRRDGRISNFRLGEQVHLSPSAVYERVRRLQREGYILGYQARLSHEKLGMEAVSFVEVKLELMNSAVMRRFEEAVRASRTILECHMIAGNFDYLLRVLVSDMNACRTLATVEISNLPGVRQVRTRAGLRLPDSATPSCCDEDPSIDELDLRLLRLLQDDGRCGVARLAEELDVTAAVVRQRLSLLSRKGFILGYGAVLNETKLLSGSLVFAAVRTTPDASGIGRALLAAAQTHREIVECHEVTGNFSHLLKLRVPDMRTHSELMESVVWPLVGVREVRTYAVIDEVKNTSRIPV